MDPEEVNLDDDFDDGSDDGDPDFDFMTDAAETEVAEVPATQNSSRPASTPASSCASSPPVLGDEPSSPSRSLYSSILTHGGSTLVFSSGGKPHNIRRGPGRPRKEFLPGQRPIPKEHRIIKRVRGGAAGISSALCSNIMRGLKSKHKMLNQWTQPSSSLLTQLTAPTQQDNNTMPNLLLQSPVDDTTNSLMSGLSFDSDIGMSGFQSDKVMQPPEEPPYFPEKWPGKQCALCCLGERSQLGQGEMLRIEISDDDPKSSSLNSSLEDKQSSNSQDDKSPKGLCGPQLSNRRQKGLNKCKNPVMTSEYVDELEKVGYTEAIDFACLNDGGYFYVHRACAIWSIGVTRDPSGTLGNVAGSISQSLARKCSYCNRFGASMACKMSCPKNFHLPCISASGGFQIIQNYTAFCKEHLGQVPLVCSEDINCRACSGLGDVANLMICSSCGDHYHGSCVGVAQLPGVRAGWQCQSCRRCQICRVPDSTEGRSLTCEQCDKIYHAHCLRPVMTSIPKYGWKCKCCRVCSDCGSRTPGAGTSSRWHAHYTVCDSCYQQRNKGFSCPICHRAYRAAAYREMIKCSVCNKFVHNTCDSDADLSVYHQKKESQSDYEYVCPPCKTLIQNGRLAAAMRRTSSVDEESMSASQESLYSEEQMDVDSSDNNKSSDFGLGKGKPFAASKVAKKRLGLTYSQNGRAKGAGKTAFQKRARLADFGRKRGPKVKMRGVFGVPGLGLQRPTSDANSKTDEEPGIENRLVLCSAKDKFVLTQDICVMCGAIGTDQEGCLISCVQCGQCYHPYCVTVKVTKVVLQKGWRCLDCTVCEGCGQKNDEGRLILCDDCDISYHIYCMDPPLEVVPQGTWKCKWCVSCQKCGSNVPGFNSAWQNSYSECGPCASQCNCPSCGERYSDGELIIQCAQCERWLHGACDLIKNDDDAEICAEEGYSCLLCRPKDQPPPHLIPKKKLSPIPPSTQKSTSVPPTSNKSSDDVIDYGTVLGLDGTHYMDGICLSENGLHHIKSLQMELIRKKRKNKLLMVEPPPVMSSADKEAGIMAAIESVVAGSSVDNSIEDIKLEPLDPKEEAEIYKDGMVWDRADSSPPEGFTICTTEQGQIVLRKKRQRNLQKLGIGGFVVRNRTIRKEGSGAKDESEDMPEYGSTANESNDKKKKGNRRKPKSKLSETYPSYLQEAFFGKVLMDNKKMKFDSSSSDDETKSNVSDDKTIKLSMEELKMIEQMRAKQQEHQQQQKQQQQLVNEQKKAAAPATSSQQQKSSTVAQQSQSHQPVVKTSIPVQPLVTEIKTEPSAGICDDIDNSDAEALKDVLPVDLLDNDLVNRIMNEDDELTKHSGTFDDITDDRELANAERKDELAEILDPHFNLEFRMDSKDVEEIFKGVLTDESQESQDQIQPNIPKQPQISSNISQLSGLNSGQTSQQLSHQMVVQQGQQTIQQQQHVQSQGPQQMHQNQQLGIPQHPGLGQTKPIVGPSMNLPSPQPGGPQQPSHGVPMGQLPISISANQSPQHIQMNPLSSLNQQQIQQRKPPQQIISGQQQSVASPLPQQQQQQPSPQLGYQNYLYSDYGGSMQYNPSYNEPVQSNQWNSNLNQNVGMPASHLDPTLGSTGISDDGLGAGGTPAPPSYNQRTSERMRQDESLEDMATISAVLYANINHPELKLEYPNWTDRCKQILKKWRALSGDKKSPFLQRARDNRSALRMKKAQQVPPMSPKDSASSSSSPSSAQLTSTTVPPQQQQQQQQSQQQSQAQQGQLIGGGDRSMVASSTDQTNQLVQSTNVAAHHQQLYEVQGKSGDGKLDELTQTNQASASNSNTTTTSLTLSTSTNPVVETIVALPSTDKVESMPTVLVAASAPQSDHNNHHHYTNPNPLTNNNNNNANVDVNKDAKTANKLPINIAASAVVSATAAEIVPKIPSGSIVNNFIALPQQLAQSGKVTANPTSIGPSLNVIVSQPLNQFVKTVTIGAGGPTNKSIFVPNVIATNLTATPQFTVGHHQFGLHHHNSSGPAPNVTVNPNGNFNTNSNAIFRPGFTHAFRPFNLQSNTINFNVIGAASNTAISSPILAAQLQTINQIASNQVAQQQQQHSISVHQQLQQQQQPQHINIVHYPAAVAVSVQQHQQQHQQLQQLQQQQQQQHQTEQILIQTKPILSDHSHSSGFSPQSNPATPNSSRSVTPHAQIDQHIRVLTPSSMMHNSSPDQIGGHSSTGGAAVVQTSTNASSAGTSTNAAATTTAASTAAIVVATSSAIHVNNNNTNNNSHINSATIISAISNSSQQSNPASCTSNPTSQCCLPSPTTTTTITTSVAPQPTDQEKINSQQKSLREQEQERQWKQLQAMRAREQQIQQMQHIVVHDPKNQDPLTQLQISTNNPDGMGPMASPSPNSRSGPFAQPTAKARLIVGLPGQQPNQGAFQHPTMSRPVSVQIPRQGQISRSISQSPFSPQTPQSPHDQFPLSPANQSGIDPFSRPPSENSQQDPYLNSPQTPRSFGHQSPNPNRSPAYVGQSNQIMQQQAPIPQTTIRLNVGGGYATAPGTPRPQFSSDIVRPGVYASSMFPGTQSQPFTSPRSEQFPQQIQANQENNRQLRDLLQRQQMATPNLPIVSGQPTAGQSPTQSSGQPLRWNQEGIDDNTLALQQQQQQQQSQQSPQPQPNQQMQQHSAADTNTFRQPLPPGMISRPQRIGLSNTIVRPQHLPRSIIISSDVRQRFIRPPGGVIASGQQVLAQHQQQQQQTLIQQAQFANQPQGPRIQSINPNLINAIKPNEQIVSNDPSMSQRLERLPSTPISQESTAMQQQPMQGSDQPVSQNPETDGQEIPDNVTAELEKLEDENAGMGEVEGVGDLLGDLGEDDDDELFNSLTAEMGADFNILEYADPELDTLNDGEKANLLDSLDFGEADTDKGNTKKETMDSTNPPKATNPKESSNENHQQSIAQQTNPNQGEQIKNQIQLQGTAGGGGIPNTTTTAAGIIKQVQGVPSSNQIVVQQIAQNQQQSQQQQQQQQQPPPQQQQQSQPTNIQLQQLGRFKTLQQAQMGQPLPQKLQQIQQQMQQQVQQAAAMGKSMPIGTQLLSKDGAVGVVTANNNVQLSYPGLFNRTGQLQNQLVAQQRLQQLRMSNPNLHGQTQPRMILQQLQSRIGLPSQQQVQPPQVVAPGQVAQPTAPPPPPPYPGPPPPYPGNSAQQPTSEQSYYSSYHSSYALENLPSDYPSSMMQRRSRLLQEQPLLLEDLLEQEKREQERQATSVSSEMSTQSTNNNNSNNQSLLSDQDFERLRADVLNSTTPQGMPAQGLLPLQHQPVHQQSQQSPANGIHMSGQQQHTTAGIRQQFLQRNAMAAGAQQQWRPNLSLPLHSQLTAAVSNQSAAVTTAGGGSGTDSNMIRKEGCSIPLFNANLQPPPPIPPDTIVTEHDRQIQIAYEQWLSTQNTVLTNQLKYYETEVMKLRKVRKSLNSKQRVLRKSGNELTQADAIELTKVSSEQSIVQKQLESARKQARQHGIVIQEYKNKQTAKIAPQMISPLANHPGSSPAHMAPQSPLMSSSPSSQPASVMQTVPSPIGNPMLQPTHSPLHSPSPLMSQSPGPASVNSILQSPGNQANSSMSPYSSMQPSPRIGTPHSQTDDNPFSPSGTGASASPSIPGRLTSPAPRMTSPQHRIGVSTMMAAGRVVTSPVNPYGQQILSNQQQQQQNRFARPQGIGIQSDRPRITMMTMQQQQGIQGQQQQQQMQQQQQQIQLQQQLNSNSSLGSPQPIMSPGHMANNQHNMDHIQNQRTMQLVQQRQMIQRQQQMLQQQQQQQHQQQQQQHQQQQQANQQHLMSKLSPGQLQQPQSPLIGNQGGNTPSSPMPRSPLVQYSPQQQPQTSPMIGGSPLMRRPPSAGGPLNSPSMPERPHSVDNLQKPAFMQHQQIHHQQQQSQQHMDADSNNSSGGGGMHLPFNPIPLPPSFARYGYFKLGLFGGSPIYSMGKGKRMPNAISGETDSSSKSNQSDAGSETQPTKVIVVKKKSPVTGVVQHAKVASLVNQDYGEFDDGSNASSICSSPGTSQASKTIKRPSEKRCPPDIQMDDIVVIDSSPDEKQRIIDYDDDNDKPLVGTEVSLSSVATNVMDVDEMSVIYDTATGSDLGIVSSPLDEVVEDYPLFPCVVDYVDSDDSMKHRQITDEETKTDLINVRMTSPAEDERQSIAIDSSDGDEDVTKAKHSSGSPEFCEDGTSDEHFPTTEEDLMSMGSEIVIMDSAPKSPVEEPVITTVEDFEAMIDSGNSKDSKDGKESISSIEGVSEPEKEITVTTTTSSTQPSERTVIAVVVTQNATTGTSTSVVKSTPILTYSRVPITASTILNTKSALYTTTAAAVHKKLKDATQTTAKVSIGNTTISVPVLKTVPNISHNKGPDAQTKKLLSQPIGISLSKSPTVLSVGGQKINTSSIVTLSNLNLHQTANARIVQALARTSQQQHLHIQQIQQQHQLHLQKQQQQLQQQQQILKQQNALSPQQAQATSRPSSRPSSRQPSPQQMQQAPSPQQSIPSTSSNQSQSSSYQPESSPKPQKKLKTKKSSDKFRSGTPSLSYNLSSLKVTQDVLLPTKIFDDESVSPDSSFEGDDTDFLSSDQLDGTEIKDKPSPEDEKSNVAASPSSNQSANQEKPMDVDDLLTDEWKRNPSPATSKSESLISLLNEKSEDSLDLKPQKQQGVIPVHVIIKSRESSRSPILNSSNQRLLSSAMPQLSPLSQSSEMTANVTSASQQLRSIMTSLNQQSPVIQPKSETGGSPQEKKNFENIFPGNRHDGTKSEMTVEKVKVHTIQSVDSMTKMSKIQQSHQTGQIEKSTPSTSGGSIVVLKQLKTSPPSSSGHQTTTQSAAILGQIRSQLNSGSANTSAVIVQPIGQQQTTSSVIISQKMSTSESGGTPSTAEPSKESKCNIVSILSSNSKLSYSDLHFNPTPTSQPPALIMASPSVISSNISSSQTTASTTAIATSIPSSAISASFSSSLSSTAAFSITSASSTQAIQNILQSSLHSRPLSGSILSQTLSQPSIKTNHTMLQSQLLSGPFRRSKSTDEVPGFMKETPAPIIGIKRHSLEAVKDDLMDTSENKPEEPEMRKQTPTCGSGGQVTISIKSEDSQNVLLKQLLQNSGSNNAPSPTPPTIVSRPVTAIRAPSLGAVSTLEAQLARPVIPPVQAPTTLSSSASYSAQTPPVTTTAEQTKPPSRPILSRETSFVSKPIGSNVPSQSSLEMRKSWAQSFLKKDVPSHSTAASSIPTPPHSLNQTIVSKPSEPPPPYSVATAFKQQFENSIISTIANQSNVIVKNEICPSTPAVTVQPSPMTPTTVPLGPSSQSSADAKLHDDTSQQSILSEHQIKIEPVCKDEMPTDQPIDEDPVAAAKTAQETALELKRKKRREYQKNRRQMQILSKESQSSSGSTKKKPRKLSKVDEDYDTLIDNLMIQLRTMAPMQILEPLLSRNYGICPALGTGDVTKFGTEKDYSFTSGDLKTEYGRAEIPNVADIYNTKPFGCMSPPAEQQSSSTHYGFYDQEFSPIKFDTVDEPRYKYDSQSNKERDAETPDTVISSSSPECVFFDPPGNFPGLRLIQEESDDNEESMIEKRMSPRIPIIAPIPIRLKAGMSLAIEKPEENKENSVQEILGAKPRFCSPVSLKDKSNVTVTLTLTSSAAEDILGVLRDLANILHIPPPTTYQIVERTTTPPSQKLGLYRTRGKDGKEGAPIDIQTILNGAAKFCRHCDVVILNTIIRAKASEFPLLAMNSNELVNDSDDLYFCSKSCYKQFQWRPTSILKDKSFELSGPGTGTYDDTTFKTDQKDATILLTTSASAADMSDEDLKMNIDINETDLKDVGIYIKDLDIKTEIKDEMDTSFEDLSDLNDKKDPAKMEVDEKPSKQHKGVRYKCYSAGCFKSPTKVKKMNEREITEMLFRMNITVMPQPKIPEDTRKCIFCHQVGDGVADGPSRLLNYDVDKWVHLNCALWSDGVYETVNGALMNLENALQQSFLQACTYCHHLGATIKCFKTRCVNLYHLSCALKDNCVFYKNKTTHCASHALKTEKDNELTTLSVQRRVYVERDESRQVAAVMHHSELSNLLRVGSLIFLSVGQLLPHQLQNFHTANYIYPIGYKIIRFYWSMRRPNKRCRYICSIADVCGRPEFRVLVQEPLEEDIELRDSTPKGIWSRVLERLAGLRKDNQMIQIFPKYVSGEDLFGLTEPAVVRILESLPGIETLTDYRFKYGRNPLLELPLAINPSGAARTEPKPQQNLSWKKPHTQRTGSASHRPAFVPSTSVAGEVACPYSKQFVHSKSSQYKKMKQEWRNNVFLARSKIQGLGLYAARDLEKHTMVIEYIGEVIRSELSELREKQYEAKNRGIYMFRLDEDRVVDATLSGGLARYINHSCNPNCVTEIVDVDRECRIIIFAKRKINRGEELSYDYKFDIEDDSHKISCMCGAPNCRKWMN